MTLRAYAKLNLILSVATAEPSTSAKPGFHRIASWMATIDLFDELTISRLPPGAPSELNIRWSPDAPRNSPIDWPPEKDLAFRALRLLEHHTGQSLPARINLLKRIPVGGGLGGGSSDAAATLLALNELFDLDLPINALREIGGSLGSDVAFFLDDQSQGDTPPRPALVLNFGETIERLPRVESPLILIIPPFGCPTPAVYKRFDEYLPELIARERITPPKTANESLVRKRAAKAAATGLRDGLLFNDLAIPARLVEPRLGALVSSLANGLKRDVHITGSGSCMFVPTSKHEQPKSIERVRRVLDASETPQAVVFSTNLV